MAWVADVKQIFIRRCDEYGDPLTGVAVVTKSVSGVDIELLKCDEFTRMDHTELQNIIAEYFGNQCYNSKRFKQLTKRGNKMATTTKQKGRGGTKKK